MAASAKSNASSRRFKLIPRMFEGRVVQLRRDLQAVLADLRGERTPAWSARDGSRYALRSPASAGLVTRELEVAEVIHETDAAVSLVLRDPNDAPLPPIRPGQFFTLLVELDGETVRRAYSVSSDCTIRERFSVTIKRVEDGRVSNHLNNYASPGMRLRVFGPSGEFGCEPEPARAQARKLVLIAGGSGVTPMMGLLRTLLPVERDCEIVLVYANRSPADVIFAQALAQLAAEYPSRFTLHSLLERGPDEWYQRKAGHQGHWIGRCDPATLAAVLDEVPLASDPAAQFLICGPAPMMDVARALLTSREVATDRVHCEQFVAPRLHADAADKLHAAQVLTIVTPQRQIEVVVQPGQTLLEAGLAAGVAMPYSCAMGGCAACKCVLEQGEVIQREPNCLGPNERARGYVLACIANPATACRVRLVAPISTRVKG